MLQMLYLLTKVPSEGADQLFPEALALGECSVVFLQEGIRAIGGSVGRAYVLEKDGEERNLDSRFPAITYDKLLNLIFEAERVVVL